MYDVKTVDLTAARADDLELAQPRKRIAEIILWDLPAGAVFNLRVGQGNPLMPISRPFSMEPQGDDEANNGLYLQNVAQAGVSVTLVIVYGNAGGLNPILT